MGVQDNDELRLMKQRVLEQARRVSPNGIRSLDLILDADHNQAIFRLEVASPEHRAALLACFGCIEVGPAMYFKRPLPAKRSVPDHPLAA